MTAARHNAYLHVRSIKYTHDPTMDLAALTLREFYEQHFCRSFLIDARPKTFEAYTDALNKWDACHRETPLHQIDSLALASFKADLAASTCQRTQRPLAKATVNKHLRHVQALLNKAGPPGPNNRDALGLVERVAWTKPLRQIKRRPRIIPPEHLQALYAACERATLPKLSPPGPQNWWRAFLVTAYNIGSRRTAILRLRQNSIDWHAQQITLDAGDDKCGEERTKPLNTTVLRHLLTLRHPQRIELFPWPYGWTAFYKQWHALCDAAGIERPHYVPHDLKRTCVSTMLDVAEAFTVQQMADHASIATTQLYANRSEKLRPAAEAMPQPWERQLDLFDRKEA